MTKVFISWSGDQSRQLGEALRDWLPQCVQFIRPYFTPIDIEKGARWASEIQKELSDSNIGIFIITHQNLKSEWLHFEAGAISRQLETSHVCPLLFGLQPADVIGPFSQFQATQFNKNEAKKLITNINDKSDASIRLNSYTLDSTFQKWWPDLDEAVSKIIESSQDKSKDNKKRADRDIIEEILLNVRNINKNVNEKNRIIANSVSFEIISGFKNIIFADYSDLKYAESQLKAISTIETLIFFELESDSEESIKIQNLMKEGRRKVERNIAKLISKNKLDDDIPF